MRSIAQNLQAVLENIEKIRVKNNLRQEIKLIAVSKTFPADAVKQAYAAGQLVFGENKVQEGEQKKNELSKLPLEWHLIGHLQTNKAKKAAEIFDWIHSVDSFKLAEKISKACAEFNKTISILIQVNTSGEASKSGLNPDLNLIKEEIEKIKIMPNILLKGFMTIGPLSEDPKRIRESFVLLRNIREKMQAAYPD